MRAFPDDADRNAFCAPLASDGMDTLTMSYPGVADLRDTEKGDFSGRLGSFFCFREGGVEFEGVS